MPSILVPRTPLSRRTVLRGLGASVALPFLDAMQSVRANSAPQLPVRLGVLYMPNGVREDRWTPEGQGGDFKFSPILKALEPHRRDVAVLTQLGNKNSEKGDGHYAKTANWLTGTPIAKTTGKDLHCGVSMDQVMARLCGQATRFPSLELGTEPVHSGVDFNVNYTQLYGSHIAWRTPTTPLPPEINPRWVFNRLFREDPKERASKAAEGKSVLDLVLANAKSLRARVGHDDQQRLDEYLESIRVLEQRIDADIARVASGENAAPALKAEIAAVDRRIDSAMGGQNSDHGGRLRLNHTDHCQLMMDLMTLAFWSDSSRVSTFMFGWAVSGRNFSFLDGVKLSHHELSHHGGDQDKLAQYEKINNWHVEQFAYLLNRMKSIREGDGTLLDHCQILFGSSLRDGNRHDPHNLPLVLAGHGGGLKMGQHIVSPHGTPLCNLYLTMLQSAGAKVDRFGDSTGRISDLG